MDNGFSNYFLISLSLSLFGLCINKLQERVNKVAKEEGLDGLKFIEVLIFIFLYVNDVGLFSYIIDVMQHSITRNIQSN